MNWRTLTLGQLIPGRRLRRAAFVLLVAALFIGAAAPTIGYADTAPAPPRRPAYALADNLIAYWKLEEASGTRYDELNGCGGSGCDLTDNNTVTQNTGIIGNAGQFTAANGESLTHVDDADLSTGDIDFTVAAWVFLDSKSSIRVFTGKLTTLADVETEYVLWYNNSDDRFRFGFGNGVTSATTFANTFGSPSTGTWYLLIGWYDSSQDKGFIAINAGSADSSAVLTAAVASHPFRIGASGGSGQYQDGRIDSVGFWKRVLTSDERTWLYNSGAGCDYPFTACEPTATFTATFTPTVTNTFTPTITDTPTITPTFTDTPTITHTPTFTPTVTDTPTVTHTPTDTPTVTHTSTSTNTPTVTHTPTITNTPGPYEYDIDAPLSSGNRFLILRRFTFGEIALGVLVLAIVLGGIGKFVYNITRET